MVNAIGLRCYLITSHRERDPERLGFDDDLEFELTPARFLENFIEVNSSSIRDDERERSWYFEEVKKGQSQGSSKGYIHYGTYGFESNFIDPATKIADFRRTIDHVEEIPLFYEFWRPASADYALAAFQSFAGRSCVTSVSKKLDEMFRVANPGYSMKVRKLVPDDGSGSVYAQAPVKQLRFIRKNDSSDIADRYIGHTTEAVDVEFLIRARRRKSLGPFGSISTNLKRSGSSGTITYDGVEFTEAVASIRVGGKYRPVGVFGASADTGVIDITSDVKKGPNGHPTFGTVEKQCEQILVDFDNVISRRRR